MWLHLRMNVEGVVDFVAGTWPRNKCPPTSWLVGRPGPVLSFRGYALNEQHRLFTDIISPDLLTRCIDSYVMIYLIERVPSEHICNSTSSAPEVHLLSVVKTSIWMHSGHVKMPGVTVLCVQGSFALLSVLDSCSEVQCDTGKLSKNNSVTATQREQGKTKEHTRVICFGRSSCFFLAPCFCWHSKGLWQAERKMTNPAACSPQSCSSCGTLHGSGWEGGRGSRIHNWEFSQKNCTCPHQWWLGGLGFLPATALFESFNSLRISALTSVKGHWDHISVIKYHHSSHYGDDELQKQVFLPRKSKAQPAFNNLTLRLGRWESLRFRPSPIQAPEAAYSVQSVKQGCK